jgi:SH3-like domain-containing protein
LRRFVLGLFGLFVLVSYFSGEDKQPAKDSKTVKEISASEPIVQAPMKVAKVEPPKIDSSVSIQSPSATETKYVTGKRVALRSNPSKDGKVLDRLNNGQALELLEAGPEWSKVRDTLTRREGYIASRLLSDKPLKNETVAKPKVDRPKVEIKPAIDQSAIIARIIQDSISAYPGNCPCPYNRDKGGRSCGKRSAYSKPGGYDPICFPQDVTPNMIESYVARN